MKKNFFIIFFLAVFSIKSCIEISEYKGYSEIEEPEIIFYESFDKKILYEFYFIKKLRGNDFFYMQMSKMKFFT